MDRPLGRPPDHLLDRIRHMTDRRPDGCVVWLGATKHGHPVVRDDGRIVTVRRRVWEAEKGVPPPRVLGPCPVGGYLCINPDHATVPAKVERPRPAWESDKRPARKPVAPAAPVPEPPDPVGAVPSLRDRLRARRAAEGWDDPMIRLMRELGRTAES